MAARTALRITGIVLAASFGFAAQGFAQTTQRPAAPAAQQRPAFCLLNGIEGLPVTAEIRAGKASTRIEIPSGQNACCVKFCAENPAPSGYQLTLTAQPPGGKQQQLCKISLASGKILRVSGSIAQARCDEARLQAQ